MASDLGLHASPMSHKKDASLIALLAEPLYTLYAIKSEYASVIIIHITKKHCPSGL